MPVFISSFVAQSLWLTFHIHSAGVYSLPWLLRYHYCPYTRNGDFIWCL